MYLEVFVIRAAAIFRPQKKRRSRGLSLMEVLMLVTILGIVGAGAGLSLQAVAKTPGQTDTILVSQTNLVSKMEELRSIPFDTLPTGTNVAPYSTSAVKVDIAYADPYGGTGGNAFFKRITVTSNGTSLVTLVCKP
jgi:hypothetical protein